MHDRLGASTKDRVVYRSDIDGLRAVAVLSVVFYHLKVPPFTGGVVGVDIFLCDQRLPDHPLDHG